MEKYYLEEKNNRGKNMPQKKKLNFKTCKDNTIKSLYDVEKFLNKFQNCFKYIKLYKILK